MSLRKRTLLTVSLLVVGLTAGALLLAGLRLEDARRSRAEQDLQATMAAARQLGNDRIDRLAIEAEVLATLLPGTGMLAGAGDPDLLDLVSSIGANRQLPGLIVVCDTDLSCATSAQALSTEEILASGATEGSPVRPRQGLLAVGSRFFEFASRPVTGPRGEELGFVLAGDEVEPAIAQSMGRQTGAEVVLVAGGQSIGSTLPLGTAAEAVELPATLDAETSTETTLRDRRYLARFLPLSDLMPQWGSSQPGAGVLMMVPLDQTPVWGHPLMRDILLLGLATLAVALLTLWLVGRPLDRSLTRLTEAISRGAATGRLQEEFTGYAEVVTGAPEIDGLRDALRSLMSKFELIQRDREKSYVEAIGAVVAAIDARDHETIGHSFRVAHYACALARVVGIEGEDLRLIEWGALLHDVGKIAVPDAILRKQGSLTEQEWEVMRQHPNWGFEMLADVEFLRPALDIVYSHHERWDGSGYPQGRRAKEIPLAARIFAVVDTYDAITSDRPYRRAKTYSDAVAELVRVSGEQLDPEMVEAFIRIPEAELRRLRELSEQLDLGERIPQTLTNQIELQQV